jgi:hypothetical protein
MDSDGRGKVVDFADFQGPPSFSAYELLADGPLKIANGFWPDECHFSKTICEDLFFPRIALPTMIYEIEPAWTSCEQTPRWVWDPPIVMTGTPYVATASVTVKSRVTTPQDDATAAPGPRFPSPNGSPTPAPIRPDPMISTRMPHNPQGDTKANDPLLAPKPTPFVDQYRHPVNVPSLQREKIMLIDQDGNTREIEPSLLAGKTTSIDQYGRTKVVDVYTRTEQPKLLDLSHSVAKTALIGQNGRTVLFDVSSITRQPKLGVASEMEGRTISINRNGQTFLVDSQSKEVTSIGQDGNNDFANSLSDKDGSIPKPGQFHKGRRKKNGTVAFVGLTIHVYLLWTIIGLAALL